MTNNKIFSLTVILMAIVGISSIFAGGKKESTSNTVTTVEQQNVIVENSVSNNQEIEYTLTVINNSITKTKEILEVYVSSNKTDDYVGWWNTIATEKEGCLRLSKDHSIFSFSVERQRVPNIIHINSDVYIKEPFCINWPVNITNLTIVFTGTNKNDAKITIIEAN